MADARAEMLRRIQSALRDVPAAERPGEVPLAREYRRAGVDVMMAETARV
ncbi:MAG TPA: hypothetical protein PKK15_17825 [Kouleothrix sp.]|nr:hypothetical protein [Kouleothrix sp.]